MTGCRPITGMKTKRMAVLLALTPKPAPDHRFQCSKAWGKWFRKNTSGHLTRSGIITAAAGRFRIWTVTTRPCRTDLAGPIIWPNTKGKLNSSIMKASERCSRHLWPEDLEPPGLFNGCLTPPGRSSGGSSLTIIWCQPGLFMERRKPVSHCTWFMIMRPGK